MSRANLAQAALKLEGKDRPFSAATLWGCIPSLHGHTQQNVANLGWSLLKIVLRGAAVLKDMFCGSMQKVSAGHPQNSANIAQVSVKLSWRDQIASVAAMLRCLWMTRDPAPQNVSNQGWILMKTLHIGHALIGDLLSFALLLASEMDRQGPANKEQRTVTMGTFSLVMPAASSWVSTKRNHTLNPQHRSNTNWDLFKVSHLGQPVMEPAQISTLPQILHSGTQGIVNLVREHAKLFILD